MSRPKTYRDFQETLTSVHPPTDWPDALKALWYDAQGNWEASHDIAQDMHNTMGSWIHAYLHRKEGDEFNAGYWYRRAQKPFPKVDLETELKNLVERVVTDQ